MVYYNKQLPEPFMKKRLVKKVKRKDVCKEKLGLEQ